MTPYTRISITNIVAIGGLACTVVAATSVLYGQQQTQVQKVTEQDRRIQQLEQRLTSIDINIQAIREGQIRLEARFSEGSKKGTHGDY